MTTTFLDVEPWRGDGTPPRRGHVLHRLSRDAFLAANDLDMPALGRAMVALDDAEAVGDAILVWVAMSAVYVPEGEETQLEITEFVQPAEINARVVELVDSTLRVAVTGNVEDVAVLVNAAMAGGDLVVVPYVTALVRNAQRFSMAANAQTRHVWMWHMMGPVLSDPELFANAEGVLELFEASWRNDQKLVRDMIGDMPVNIRVHVMLMLVKIMAEYLDPGTAPMYLQVDENGLPGGMIDPMAVDLDGPGPSSNSLEDVKAHVERAQARFVLMAQALACNTEESLAEADRLLGETVHPFELRMMVFTGMNAVTGLVRQLEAAGTRVHTPG